MRYRGDGSLRRGLNRGWRRENGAKRILIEALEERATPTGGFGYAFGLGGAGGDTVNRVVADSLGNVYVAGSFSSTVDIDPGPEVFELTNTGGADGFLAKYAPDGSLVWADQIPDTTPTDFSRFALAIDADGGVYLTGGQAGSAFVSKYTESGDLAWTRTLGGSGTASGTGIAVDATGNVFTTGVYSGGTIDLDPGSGTFIKSADGTSPNSYISKLDSSGNFVWGGAFEGQPMTSSWIIAGDMVMDQEENLYITGTFVGTVDFEPGSGTVLKTASSTNSRAPSGDAFVAKITSTGELSYLDSMGSPDAYALGASIAVDSDGVAYVSGCFETAMTILGPSGNSEQTLTALGTSPTARDVFVLKLNAAGELSWAERFGGDWVDSANAVTLDSSGDLYVTGYFVHSVDFDPGPGSAVLSTAGLDLDAFVLRLDPGGNYVSVAQLGGPGDDVGVDIATDNQGDIFTVGMFSDTTDFDPGSGVYDVNAYGDRDYDGFVSELTGWAYYQPLAPSDDTYSTDEDRALDVPADGVLANDMTRPGDPVEVSLVTGPDHGSLSLKSDGSFVYTPFQDFNGQDSFTYRISDGTVSSKPAAVSLTVNPVNDPPVASDLDKVFRQGVESRGTVHAIDVDGDSLSYSIVSQPQHGQISAFDPATGAYSYQPEVGYFGSDSFSFQASDGQAESNVANVSIQVLAFPVVTDDSWRVWRNTTLSVSAVQGVLQNDTIANGDSLSVVLVAGPAHGTLTLKADGSFVYVPEPGYTGQDSFSYQATNGTTESADGIVALEVKSNQQAMAQQGDYDGDGKADILVFRPETATFSVSLSSGGGLTQQWGWANHDQPLIGDYDGDGKTDVAVFRPETATFYAKLSSGGVLTQQWGWVGHDQAETGDYDGDGKTDVAVFRPDNAIFYVKLSSGGSMTQQWGWAYHDQPQVGDYDGDGKTDFAVYRPQNGTFYVKESSGGTLTKAMVNTNSPLPLTGDYDGDGKTDFAVYQANTAVFNVAYSSGGTYSPNFGWAGHDLPISGDYDGDGKTDYAVFRPDTATFYVSESSGAFLTQQWGWVGHDEPVDLPASWYSVADNAPTGGSGHTTVSAQSVSTRSKVQNLLDRYGLAAD